MIKEKLTELGDSPDHIAAKLRQLRIKGYRGNPVACPIAKYLKTITLEGYTLWSVQRGKATFRKINTTYPMLPEDLIRVNLPTPVIEFIWKFDHGMYPGLATVVPPPAS